MKISRFMLPALCALAASTAPASAQEISLEARGSLLGPSGDFGDVADGSAGFGADVFLTLSPSISVYGGYASDMFDSDVGSSDITSSGFETGVKYIFSRTRGVLPWARIGGIFNTLDVEDGGIDAESDRGFGFQGAVGVDIPLGDKISFTPALRYQAFDADFDAIGGAFQTEQEVRYFAIDFGIHFHPQG